MKFLQSVNLLVFVLISVQAWPFPEEIKGKTFGKTMPILAIFANPKIFNSAAPYPKCGVPKQKFLLKLIAGEQAKAETWPWVVAIAYASNQGPHFNCSGNLISNRHILTSAQCVTEDMSFVTLGALNLNANEGINVPIEKGLVHADYNPQTSQHDIAIIVLAQKLQFTDSVRPICLPFSKELQEKDFTDYTPITAGWKINKRFEDGRDPFLRQYQTMIRSSSECKAKFQGLYPVNNRFICAARGDEEFFAGTGGTLMQPHVGVLYFFLFLC